MTGEEQAVERTLGGPMTPVQISQGLADLGVAAGDMLLVHASLSSLGFVAGGAQSLIEALQTAVGPRGLIVMPTFSAHLSDPATWTAPPVPQSWWPVIRAETPAYDRATTPSRGMGAAAEVLRTSRGAIRGPHPQHSFTAWGQGGADIVSHHPLSAFLGRNSPLQRLYDKRAKVLLLGADYESCTAFHLAEHYLGRLRVHRDGAPIIVGGQRIWVEFDAPDYATDRFAAIGAAFEAEGGVSRLQIGAADCRLFPIKAAVDFAAAWFAIEAG